MSYNGSLIQINGRQLLVYRHEDNHGQPPYQISAIWKDKPDQKYHLNTGTYDPRLVNLNNQIYMFSTDHTRVHIGEIKTDNKITYHRDRKLDTDFLLQKQEKNWLPFINQDELYLVYNFDPHIILCCNPELAFCHKEYTTKNYIKWNHGKINGGSSPILIGIEYLSFFHSWREISKESRMYHIGAYTFQNQPPFKILKYTTTPLWQEDFYTTPSISRHKVLFPTSAYQEGEDIIMTYGENDATTKYAKFNLKSLLALMKPNI
jgi:predicted GH43/DUF377 family glycosyl hydrolase